MRKAFSLIEAMVAIGILTIIISVGTNIIFLSADTENVNKSLLIANELALEGVEAVQNIYDTNLLKYGESNKDRCALIDPKMKGEDADTECIEANQLYSSTAHKEKYLLLSRNYTSDKIKDMLTWSVREKGNTSIIADNNLGNNNDSKYKLYLYTICSDTPCSAGKYIGQVYAVKGAVDEAFNVDPIPTQFYREVMTEYTGDVIQVTALIHWTVENNRIRTIKKSLILNK